MSASSGSISTTATRSPCSQDASAAATGGATRSGRSRAGWDSRLPIVGRLMSPILHAGLVGAVTVVSPPPCTLDAVTDPLVIAHRGACGHRPEHTAGATGSPSGSAPTRSSSTCYATRDGVLVCRHDLELSRTTDVATRPELPAPAAHASRSDGEVLSGWFVHDLTLAELRDAAVPRAVAPQACGQRDVRRHAGRCPPCRTCSTSSTASRPGGASRCGCTRSSSTRRSWTSVGLYAARPGRAVSASAPDLDELRPGGPAPARGCAAGDDLVRLHDEPPTGREVAVAASYASGIGVRRDAVIGTDLVAQAHRRGLDVLVWTHRAENQHLPTDLRVGDADHAHGQAQRAAEQLYDAGVDAVITDFPETSSPPAARCFAGCPSPGEPQRGHCALRQAPGADPQARLNASSAS